MPSRPRHGPVTRKIFAAMVTILSPRAAPLRGAGRPR
jgi:hypothetical protein